MKALLTKQKMINKVILIPEYKIKPNPYQPRKVFDEEKIEQLATSIAQYGLLQPITVLPMEDGNYQLVAGERRLLACRRLKMQEVPAILTSMDEERSSALALVENIQRCDLNYFEEAMAIQKLMKMVGYTQQAVAKKLGKNQHPVHKVLVDILHAVAGKLLGVLCVQVACRDDDIGIHVIRVFENRTFCVHRCFSFPIRPCGGR